MLIQVDFNSGEPVTRQVIAQVKWMVASGKLQPGEKLPSVRQFAKQLKVNPTTVTRIYAELSSGNVIVLRQGQGAFVCTETPSVNRTEARKGVRKIIRNMLAEGVRLGLSPDDLRQLIEAEIKKLPEESK